MRISKDPEVRKREMIDTAMEVFSEKGYEATKMTDIARAMNVVSGLCYRYFKSKEELYREAVHTYALECSESRIQIMEDENLTSDECLEQIGLVFLKTDGNERYHEFFHKKGNEIFHKQLEIEMLNILEPHAIKALERYNEKEHLKIRDCRATAQFILYGCMPVLNDEERTSEQKIQTIMEVVSQLF